MTYRPRICPFHRLIEQVPQNSTVLDVGCGNGLWLLLLAELGRIRQGIGFDICAEKVRLAQELAGPNRSLSFRPIAVNEAWPDMAADCVTMIDIIHHIHPERQKETIRAIQNTHAERILIKDIDPVPAWKSAANTLHDLALSGQRPRYQSPSVLCEWLGEIGYEIRVCLRCDMLWYSHYLIVGQKPAKP